MSESFDMYNAPQFVDFCKKTDYEGEETSDSYFEIDHEQVITTTTNKYEVKYEEVYSTPKGVQVNHVIEHEYEEIISISDDSYDEECNNRLKRRSVSVGNLNLQNYYNEDTNVTNLCDNVKNFNIKNNNTSHEPHVRPGSAQDNYRKPTMTSLNKAKSNSVKNLSKFKFASKSNSTLNSTSSTTSGMLRRALSKEHLNKLAQPKHRSQEGVSNQQHTIAEMVRQYQNKTPERFHSQPKLNCFVDGVPFVGKPTVPQSPKMLTKNRSRPVHYPTMEERELAEYEEAKRFKIKANPMKKNGPTGPLKPTQPIERKPLTVPKPFNLTKPTQKAPYKEEQFEFHAKPIPKSVIEGPKLIEFPKQVTVPETPAFVRRYYKEYEKKHPHDKENKENMEKSEKEPKPMPSKTIPEPFSFEFRDKMIQKKKEMLIQKIFEEEKKAREFHARPIPKTIYQSPGKNTSSSGTRRNSESDSSGCSSKRTKSDDNISVLSHFKAKPPTVLYKEPFVPKKEERPLVEISSMCLNTEIRAKEREKYEEYLKEREKVLEMLKWQEEQKQKRFEEEERARLRKEAEVRAQPIRKYKELQIVPSNKVTQPITPQFHTDRLRRKVQME